MPIYVVKCEKCGRKEEILVMQHLEKLPKCKRCGGEVKKVFSTFSFKINGYSYKNNYSKEEK